MILVATIGCSIYLELLQCSSCLNNHQTFIFPLLFFHCSLLLTFRLNKYLQVTCFGPDCGWVKVYGTTCVLLSPYCRTDSTLRENNTAFFFLVIIPWMFFFLLIGWHWTMQNLSWTPLLTCRWLPPRWAHAISSGSLSFSCVKTQSLSPWYTYS